MATRRGFGWEPEFPDYRDYPVKMLLGERRVSDAPNRFSLREFCSPVRDQGQIGSCTGFALCGAIELLRRRDNDQHSTIYSPLFAYYFGRVEDGIEWKNQDAGAYIRDSAKIAARIGVCPESKYKYRPERFADTPHQTATREAERWKTGAYYACNSTTDIINAISAGYPVIGGFSCFSNMFTREVDLTGRIPMPGGRFEGGHAVLFTGYDIDRREFEFKNSWSERWGNGGYGQLPFDFVNDGLADDFWCLTQESPATRQDRDLHPDN